MDGILQEVNRTNNVTMDTVTHLVSSVCKQIKMEDWCMNNLVTQIVALYEDISVRPPSESSHIF